VRAEPGGAAIPMLALASHAAPGLVERARHAGFDGFVAKFDRPRLIAAIREHVLALSEAV
jgi:two-component system chemotaxis sensor kinase CheA